MCKQSTDATEFAHNKRILQMQGKKRPPAGQLSDYLQYHQLLELKCPDVENSA